MEQLITDKQLRALSFSHKESSVIEARISSGEFRAELSAAGYTDYPDGAHGQKSLVEGESVFECTDISISILWRVVGRLDSTFSGLYDFQEPICSHWQLQGAELAEDKYYAVDDFVNNLNWKKFARGAFPQPPPPREVDYESGYFEQLFEQHDGPPLMISGVLVAAYSDWTNDGERNDYCPVEGWWTECQMYKTLKGRFVLYRKVCCRFPEKEFYTTEIYDDLETLAREIGQDFLPPVLLEA